jgi:glutamine amidotransferase
MIVIIDYGMGNLGSIANMLKQIGTLATVSGDVKQIEAADRLILAGVDAFDAGMQRLRERNLIPLLVDKELKEKVPFLGICLGMQLLTRRSEEGQLPRLGWLDAETVKFRFDGIQNRLRVPHMGWNEIRCRLITRCWPIWARSLVFILYIHIMSAATNGRMCWLRLIMGSIFKQLLGAPTF